MFGLKRSVEDQVLKAIKRALPRTSARATLTPQARLRDELGLDSLGVVSLVFELEEALGIAVPRDAFDLARLTTVADVIALARGITPTPTTPDPAVALIAAFTEAGDRFPGVVERSYTDNGRVALRLARVGKEAALGMRMFSDQDLLVSHAFGYLRYEHDIVAQPSFADPRALLFDVPADLVERDALATAVRRVIEIIYKQNLYELTRFVVGAERHHKDAVVADHRRAAQLPPIGEVDGRVAFVAHFIDARDLRLWDPSFAPFSDAELATFLDETWTFVAPFVQERFRIVSATGRAIEYQFIAIYVDSRTIAQRMREGNVDEVVEKIEQAVTLARQNGCSLIGFGGFTSIVTRNCTAVKASGIGLTTGNALTVGMGIEGIRAAAAEVGIDLAGARLAVLGAGGNIGSTYGQLIAEEVGDITLIGRQPEDPRLLAVAEEILATALETIRDAGADSTLTGVAAVIADTATVRAMLAAGPVDGVGARLRAGLDAELGVRTPVRVTADPGALAAANLIVAGSNAASSVIFPHMIGDGPTVICDIAVPMDTHPSVARERPNVRVLQGGVVQLPDNPDFQVSGLPLEPGRAFACMSETMVLGLEGVTDNFAVGRISRAQVKDVSRLAARHGFRLARLKVEHSY